MASACGLPLAVREARSSDLPIIYNSWINSLSACHPFSKVDKNWFCAAQHALITRLIQRCSALVACDPDDDDQVYGYVVYDCSQRSLTSDDVKKRTLHYVYVKYPFRRMGVASLLMRRAFRGSDDAISITCKTPAIAYHRERWNLQPASHLLVGTGV